MKMNKLLCSTGALVGRVCNYDYSLIAKTMPRLFESNLIDGMEFMMIPYYYDNLNDVCNVVNSCNLFTPYIHCEKDVGVLLSQCNEMAYLKALELLKINCEAGCKINAENMVFHLWGGTESDRNIEYNISKLPEILKITKSFGLNLLIENIPCTTHSGLENWKKLYDFLPEISFVFDTRFGAFHDEIDEILNEPIWDYIKHIHISDYSSYPRDFSKIRPILHPGDGVINFDNIFKGLKSNNYQSTVTLESPVMIEGGIDYDKLCKTLKYLRNKL